MSGLSNVQIWTMHGQKLEERIIDNSQTNVLDFSKLAKGVYLLKLTNQKQIFTQKILIE
jgi:hypothetical protein